jgi:CBS domain-containing protein
MSIGRICQRVVDLADPDETIVAAARRMNEKRVGTLVVLDEGKRPVGILTDRDLAMRVVAAGRHPEDTQVSDVMTAHPRTVSEGTPIEDALSVMRSLGIRRLLVTGQDEQLAGIVSLDDVLSLIMEEFRSMHGILEKSSPSGALVS